MFYLPCDKIPIQYTIQACKCESKLNFISRFTNRKKRGGEKSMNLVQIVKGKKNDFLALNCRCFCWKSDIFYVLVYLARKSHLCFFFNYVTSFMVLNT